MIEQGWVKKLKILKFNSSAKLHVFPNPIIINCPCSFVHHIFDNQFSFNGPKPQPFKFHFITKVERIAKKSWNIVTFIKRSLVFCKPIIFATTCNYMSFVTFSIAINHLWNFVIILQYVTTIIASIWCFIVLCEWISNISSTNILLTPISHIGGQKHIMKGQLGHIHNMCVKYTPPKCVAFNFGFHFWCLGFIIMVHTI